MESLSVEEKEHALFQPDTLLSAEFFDAFRRKRRPEPEYRLMLAVLEDAISCFRKYLCARDEKGKKLFREAEEWIFEENSDWIFSFDNTCEVLGLEPEYIRRELLRWKERSIARSRKSHVLSPPGGRVANGSKGRLRFYRLVG